MPHPGSLIGRLYLLLVGTKDHRPPCYLCRPARHFRRRQSHNARDYDGPTRAILNHSVASSMTFMFLLSGGLMSIIYYLTIWFQVVKGDSAIHSNVSTIPLLLSMVILGIPTAIFNIED
jgi:hypothetical protein